MWLELYSLYGGFVMYFLKFKFLYVGVKFDKYN